jgi:purine-nucleoside phosphorylase
MKAKTIKQQSLFQKVTKAVEAIWKKTAFRPDIAIILGTGLGNLTKQVKKEAVIPYEDIPNFPRSTVQSHAGRLVFGTLSGKRVVVMDGRFHFYEGYSVDQVTFPVRVLRKLGAKILIVSNAAGGLNLDYKKGDLVLISDHINFMGVNPLIGPNDDRLGVRFPDMSAPYSERLMKIAEQAAKEKDIPLRRGVYLGITGPNLETRAEYRFMRNMGADVIGMSTVPEVIVAVHAGFETLGISVATDICDPDHLEAVNIEEIIKAANQAGPKLDVLVSSVVQKLPDVH